MVKIITLWATCASSDVIKASLYATPHWMRAINIKNWYLELLADQLQIDPQIAKFKETIFFRYIDTATEIHFVDVGQGNMVLIKADDGARFVFDCNITQDNESRVLGYVAKVFGRGNRIRAFICSHRDADHMRGVTKLHNKNPISEIWDSGYAGTTTGSPEYTQYMNLRRKVGVREIEKFIYENFGSTRFRYFSASDNRLPKNANAQGIVIKVEQRNPTIDECLTSALLLGDSDAEVWRDGILKDYSEENLKSSILMAAHHGSNSFFEIPSNQYRYTEHLRAIKPQMVVVSVGPNTHGHPKFEALGLYETYATGSIEGKKSHEQTKMEP